MAYMDKTSLGYWWYRFDGDIGLWERYESDFFTSYHNWIGLCFIHLL